MLQRHFADHGSFVAVDHVAVTEGDDDDVAEACCWPRLCRLLWIMLLRWFDDVAGNAYGCVVAVDHVVVLSDDDDDVAEACCWLRLCRCCGSCCCAG